MNARGTRRPRGRAGPRPRRHRAGGTARNGCLLTAVAELAVLGALAYTLAMIAGVL